MSREELYELVSTNNYIIDGNYVYFKGVSRMCSGLEIEVLCRLEIKQKKQYILNKSRNVITDNLSIYNDYIEKKSKGIRGYKTIQIGIIDNYYYSDMIEFEIVGSDGKFYWWIDRENTIKSNMTGDVRNYIKGLSSEFIKVS